MNKTAIRFLIPLTILSLVGCSSTPAGTSSNGASTSSASEATGSQTLSKVLDYFSGSLSAAASYNFFDADATPKATTVFLEQGCFTTYKNFGDLQSKGMINVDADLAAKKSVEEGVYAWTKSEKTESNPVSLVLGNKLGTGTYQSLYHNPSEISSSKGDYLKLLRHESESGNQTLTPAEKSVLSGNFTLNKVNPSDESKELLMSFAKSLGVYETITSVDGMELNYANIYFGPITATINVTFYSQYKGGYSSFNTSLTCNQFGTAKISELTKYIEGE